VREELVSLIPAWIFFCCLFSLLWLTQRSILREYHLHLVPPSRALIGSIIVAKALLLVDLIPVLKKLEERAVLIGAFWKTCFYFVVVFAFQYLDLLIERRHEGWAAGSRDFLRNLSGAPFWVLQLWLVISLFAFSAARSLLRKLGPQRSRELLIGR
jgi:hypothetical protein